MKFEDLFFACQQGNNVYCATELRVIKRGQDGKRSKFLSRIKSDMYYEDVPLNIMESDVISIRATLNGREIEVVVIVKEGEKK